MSSFFTIDRANERIPEVRDLLLRLRSQRNELAVLRDHYVALTGDDSPHGEGRATADDGPAVGRQPEDMTPGATPTRLKETALVKLRIRGIVDQMGASVAELDAWGISLRDIETGLIDFPALVSGRQVWLCWRLGEDDVEWWHELETGFGGRQRLADLA